MKKTLSTIVLFLMCLALLSQEKPPEVENDYVTMLAGDTISVNVMANDWCMEGHEMKILNIWQGVGGIAAKTDSTILYFSYFYFSGIVDTIRYVLIDLNNNLMSETGYLIIAVENFGQTNLDINNVDALFQSFGIQFCTLPEHSSRFEVARGCGRKTIFS